MTAVSASATIVECPTCGAWVGWACEGRNYGYHAAGYHRSRQRAARTAVLRQAEITPAAAACLTDS